MESEQRIAHSTRSRARAYRAWWFARRFSLPSPAVFCGEFTEKDVLAYVNDRNEQEFIVDAARVRLRRMKA